MTLISKLDEVELFKSQDTSRRGAAVLDVLLQPEAIVPVYVLFAPTTMKPVRGKIVMKSEQSDRKYTVRNVLCLKLLLNRFLVTIKWSYNYTPGIRSIRGYIVFAFSVCLSVCKLCLCQSFLRNYLT